MTDYHPMHRRIRAVLRKHLGRASLEDALVLLIRDERADAAKAAQRAALAAISRLGWEDPSAQPLGERDTMLRKPRENCPQSSSDRGDELVATEKKLHILTHRAVECLPTLQNARDDPMASSWQREIRNELITRLKTALTAAGAKL